MAVRGRETRGRQKKGKQGKGVCVLAWQCSSKCLCPSLKVASAAASSSTSHRRERRKQERENRGRKNIKRNVSGSNNTI